MAFNDRQPGNYSRPSFFGGFSFFPPVIKALLITNIAVFVLDHFFLGAYHIGGVSAQDWLDSLMLWPVHFQGGTHFHIWQLFTYMFMHQNFSHIFLNMLGLWMFGMELEHVWGSRQFLFYYIFCGIGAGVAHLFLSPIFGVAAPTLGASGAIFGVLAAFGLLFPDRRIYLYFFLPLKAKYFVIGYILFELYAVGFAVDNLAHLAHLGGAVCGILYIVVEHRTRLFSSIVEKVEDLFHGIRSPKLYRDRVQHGWRDPQNVSSRDLDEPDKIQAEVDAILDKISKHGYESLTEEEKKKLFDVSKKMN